jgi:AraC-like DNA-binding protein
MSRSKEVFNSRVIRIKFMVSRSCLKAVRDHLDRMRIKHSTVELGEVELQKPLSPENRILLKEALLQDGFELLDDPRAALIERIAKIIIDMVHNGKEMPNVNFSDYLSTELAYDYTYLATIFSETKGITIERFIIANKIERAKELLMYDELSLTEISHRLSYSSVAHLSTQFKKVTGLTPTYFKAMKEKKHTVIGHVSVGQGAARRRKG